MEYKTTFEEKASCLECGAELYGRSDKRFCSITCKNNFNNRRTQTIRKYRMEITKSISRNYEILEMLIRDKVNTISLEELSSFGFNPGCVTGHRNGKHDEYSCYDILYYKTETKIFNIRRKELPTRP